MTTYCLVDPTPAVFALIRDGKFPRASEVERRIKRGDVHDIRKERDREVCWLLFAGIREQEKQRPPWGERSPLRDVINKRALIWRTGSDAKRECLARLPGEEPEPKEADYHEAVRHKWVQAELVELGWQFQQNRSESELQIIDGAVDVAWDELAWEVDLTVQLPSDQKRRERVRALAGLRMVAILDDAEPRNKLRAEVPEVYLSQLVSTAQSRSAVDGKSHLLASSS